MLAMPVRCAANKRCTHSGHGIRRCTTYRTFPTRPPSYQLPPRHRDGPINARKKTLSVSIHLDPHTSSSNRFASDESTKAKQPPARQPAFTLRTVRAAPAQTLVPRKSSPVGHSTNPRPHRLHDTRNVAIRRRNPPSAPAGRTCAESTIVLKPLHHFRGLREPASTNVAPGTDAEKRFIWFGFRASRDWHLAILARVHVQCTDSTTTRSPRIAAAARDATVDNADGPGPPTMPIHPCARPQNTIQNTIQSNSRLSVVVGDVGEDEDEDVPRRAPRAADEDHTDDEDDSRGEGWHDAKDDARVRD
ncbi:hypothetical protein C8R46DRAFT_241710 [Mycena filopes]|nr:hypothetical protein C8R46DRAFT_241710 [Mycena filopes]